MVASGLPTSEELVRTAAGVAASTSRSRLPSQSGLLSIRVLGPLEVRRADHTWVDGREWRTGKAADLLRLLALREGRAVRVQLLLDHLWPDSSIERARGSLRTAVSNIRKAVGQDCFLRAPGTLTLVHAWVDAVAFNALCADARTAMASGRHDVVLARAVAARQLYRDDFHAYDDDSEWVRAERGFLARARLDLFSDAAESALALRQFRDAVDLATAALKADPTRESAHRILMRAHAELGEVGSALRVFERYRRRLADELGVDPSSQTQELHLQLLRRQ